MRITYVTVVVKVRVRLGLRLDRGTAVLHMTRGRVTRHLFNSNNFVTSAALAEVKCALLSAVLIVAVMFRLHGHDVGLHKAFAACATLYRSRAGARPPSRPTEPMELHAFRRYT